MSGRGFYDRLLSQWDPPMKGMKLVQCQNHFCAGGKGKKFAAERTFFSLSACLTNACLTNQSTSLWVDRWRRRPDETFSLAESIDG